MKASLLARAAKVRSRLVPFGAKRFGFPTFVFRQFLVGVAEGVARREHRIGPGGLLLFLARHAKLVPHLTDWPLDGLHFHQKITDFFEEVMQMVGSNHVGESRGLEGANILAPGELWNEEEHTQPAAFLRRHGANFPQRMKQRRIYSSDSGICDQQRPFARLQLGQQHFYIVDGANTPAFRVQYLADGGCALRVVVQNQDGYLAATHGEGRGTHARSIETRAAAEPAGARGRGLSATDREYRRHAPARHANKRQKKILDNIAKKRRIYSRSYEVGYVPSSHQTGACRSQLAAPRFTSSSKSLPRWPCCA